LAGIAGFVPPPSENWGAQQVATFYADHEVRIRIGMEGLLLLACLYFVWSLAIARVMWRAEGRQRLLSTIQLIGGVATTGVTMACGVLWLTASFRSSIRPATDIQLLNDLGWMVFDMTVLVTVLQQLAFAFWVLGDDREKPLVPRWVGYATLWLAATAFVVFLMPSFQTGPFSWQGLITLYIGLGAFFVWAFLTSWYVVAAVKRIERDETVLTR
jgi:hypothetical protein